MTHPLLNAAAVRRAAHEMLARLRAGQGAWRVDDQRLDEAASLIVATTRERYPALDIPYHSRWRHFEAGGVDRRAGLRSRLAAIGCDRRAMARAEIDLVVVSVLLDAGAGPDWRFREAGQTYSRSEGLGVASLRLFEQGAFSSDPARPLQVDAQGLIRLTPTVIAQGFQVGQANPLLGLEGRTRLLNRLGAQLQARGDLFAVTASDASPESPNRPGALFDRLAAQASGSSIRAADILAVLLEGLGPMWLTGNEDQGIALGDCWPYRTVSGDTVWVPFHKLSQWLSYSLLEAFEAAGLPVVDLDALTGLPEYRNGGLLIDCGVLQLKDAARSRDRFEVGAPEIVEWRAATVALLDELAPRVKAGLGLASGQELPLAKVLEGGSWAAGRVIAQRLRGGLPPLDIISDGTVF